MPGREVAPRSFSAATLTALCGRESLGLGWMQVQLSGTQTLGDPPPSTKIELPPLLQAGVGETLWGGSCMSDEGTERVPGVQSPTLLPSCPPPPPQTLSSSESSRHQKKATAQVRSLSVILLSPWPGNSPQETRTRPASIAATASLTPFSHSGLSRPAPPASVPQPL